MEFKRMTLAEAEGALLAHSIKTSRAKFKKGRVLSKEDILALQATGVENVIAARLDEGDLSEDVEQDEEPVEEASSRSPISQRLADEMAIMKTELLRVHVASDPHFALDLGTFFMVDATFGFRHDRGR